MCPTSQKNCPKSGPIKARYAADKKAIKDRYRTDKKGAALHARQPLSRRLRDGVFALIILGREECRYVRILPRDKECPLRWFSR